MYPDFFRIPAFSRDICRYGRRLIQSKASNKRSNCTLAFPAFQPLSLLPDGPRPCSLVDLRSTQLSSAHIILAFVDSLHSCCRSI